MLDKKLAFWQFIASQSADNLEDILLRFREITVSTVTSFMHSKYLKGPDLHGCTVPNDGSIS
jgi:hypothetical protein